MDVYIPEMQFFVPTWAIVAMVYPLGFLVAAIVARRLMLLKIPRREWAFFDYVVLAIFSLFWPIFSSLVAVVLVPLSLAFVMRFFLEPRK